MKPNVLIGTPCYGSMCHTDFVNSLLGIQSAKDAGLLDYSLMTIGNESLITRARNTIISTFYYDNRFTHLFFIDADLGFPEKLLPQMLKQNKDVLIAPVPLKGKDENGNKIFNIGKILSENLSEETVEIEHGGNALMLLNRNAVEDLCNNADQYKPSSLTRGYKQINTQFDVFQVGVENGIYLSEDFYVCHKLKKLGYTIHGLNLNIPIRHNGNYIF